MKQGDLINDKYVLKKLRNSNQSNQTWQAEVGKTTVILKFVKYPMRSEQQIKKQQIIFQTSKHQNIVTIFESFTYEREASRYLVIAMQQCPDGDFARLIKDINKKKDKCELTQRLEFMMQMAKGLRYLHEKEVAHRNIKPENIFRMDGRVKIGDLDLAGIYKIKSTQQLTGGAGFPLYKAPEAHQSNAYYLQSDVWSLGLVFVELLLELRLKDLERWKMEPCFEKKEIQSLTKKIKDMNKGVYDIVMGMLETERERRVNADWVVGALNKSIQQLKKGKEKPASTVYPLLFGGSNDLPKSMEGAKMESMLYKGNKDTMQLISPTKERFINQVVEEGTNSLLKKDYPTKGWPISHHKGHDLHHSQLYKPISNYQEVEIQQINEPKMQFKKEGAKLYGQSPNKKSPAYQAGTEFTLKLMIPKGHFQEMTDQEIDVYMQKKEKKKKEKSEWFDIRPPNYQKRIKIRYNGYNDSLIIHYDRFQEVLGMQHLPIEIRFNWPTVEDLFMQLKRLKPEEVEVRQEGTITFRAKKSPNYEQRLKEHQEQQQQQTAQTQPQQASSFPVSHQTRPMASQRRMRTFEEPKYNVNPIDSKIHQIQQLENQMPTMQKSLTKDALIIIHTKIFNKYIQVIIDLFNRSQFQECVQIMKRILSKDRNPLYAQIKNNLSQIISGIIKHRPGKEVLLEIKSMLTKYMKESNQLPVVNNELAKLK